MFTIFVISIVIILAVTFTTLDYIVRACASIRIKTVRNFMFAVCCSIPFTVLVNILVSYFLLSFTGAGAVAGMANLGSSVIVGIFGSHYMRRRFAIATDPENNPVFAARIWKWMKGMRTRIWTWTHRIH